MPTTTTTNFYATILSVNSFCTHELFENGIHHIVVKKFSPETTDAYCKILDQIYTAAKPEDTIRILNESNFGPMQISTLISRARSSLSEQRHLPRTRHALLLQDTTHHQTSIVEMVTQTMPVPRHKTRYFHVNEEAQAIDWLLRDN